MTKKNIKYHDVYVEKNQTTRLLLQKEGTEKGRQSELGKDIWINYLDNWISVFSNRDITDFVITDIRFLNELEYIKNQNGILIKIIAPERNNQRLLKESNGNIEIFNKIKNHASECDLDNISLSEYDLLIYNDFTPLDIDNYINKLDEIYKSKC